MRILRTIAEMQAASRETRSTGRTLGLVPTMGAIHAGHLSLVKTAREECDVVAASIFVNPLQFGPNEDFARYPRTFEEDVKLLEQGNVDLLFAPAKEEMYPAGAVTRVEVNGISDRLDGIARPGHFLGVATIVAKLFNIVGPDAAYFGQKDAAQVAVLRAMVRDLNFPLRMAVCPTVREADGLAMSSRNRYLSSAEREQARALIRALCKARTLADSGETSAAALQSAMQASLAHEPGVDLEYAEVVNPETLEPLLDVQHGALLAVAARVGSTRLIDNLLLVAKYG